MTFEQFAAARQLLAEEKVGHAQRTRQRQAAARLEASKAAIRKVQPHSEVA